MLSQLILHNMTTSLFCVFGNKSKDRVKLQNTFMYALFFSPMLYYIKDIRLYKNAMGNNSIKWIKIDST